MNIYRIALFIFLIQSAVTILSAADVIPIKCNSDYSFCIYFNSNTIGSGTIGEIITRQVETGEYRSTQITTDVTADIYLSSSFVLQKATEVLFGAIAGMFFITTFFFGYSTVIISIAGVLQILVYYFYLRAIESIVKEGTGDI